MTAETLAAAWRIAFLGAGGPLAGAALLLAIARVTGAAWGAVAPLTLPLPALAAAAALLGLAQAATVAPAHLALWMHPLAVAARGLAAGGGLWWLAARLRSGASATLAAVALALYACLVTPVAGDWLLGHAPGHTVSSAGMMLATDEIAAACALILALGVGGRRFREDMAKLLVAAALGLGYLIFVDYLILWFGNLPARVPFYVARSQGAPALLPPLALALGWVVPVGLLWRGGERPRRWAGVSALVALFLVHAWWIGGGAAAGLLGGVASAAGLGTIVLRDRRHG